MTRKYDLTSSTKMDIDVDMSQVSGRRVLRVFLTMKSSVKTLPSKDIRFCTILLIILCLNFEPSIGRISRSLMTFSMFLKIRANFIQRLKLLSALVFKQNLKKFKTNKSIFKNLMKILHFSHLA